MQQTIWIRLATFAVWLLAVGSLVYWALKFVAGPTAPPTPAAAPAPGIGQVDAQALARGLGGGVQAATNPGATTPVNTGASNLNSSRFQLTGVVLSRGGSNRNSVALIGVDGKPPRPYRVGANLAEGVVLHSVAAGKAMLAGSSQAAAAELTLELPKINSAVVGTAVALRPALPNAPALPVGAPAGVVSASTFGSIPVGAAGVVTGQGAVPAGSAAATATMPPSAIGQRGSRSAASRQREGSRDGQAAEGQPPAQ